MKKVNNEKETIIKLYRDNISEIIWTHKIQATILLDKKKLTTTFMTTNMKKIMIWNCK